MKLLGIAGIVVVLLGVAGLAVVAAPAVWGQTLETLVESPLAQIRSVAAGGSVIGVSLRDVDSADVQREKLPGLSGAIVTDVRQDSPAAKAGLRAGDVIVSFDREAVRSARHLARLIDETPEGREVETSVVRGGERVNLKVTPRSATPFEALTELRKFSITPERRIQTFPNLKIERFSEPFPVVKFLDRSRGRLGVAVQDLTEQLGDYFGTPDGALVTGVDDGTPAKTAGLKAGDVITKINGQSVRSAAELRQRLAGLTGEVAVGVIRERKELTLKATLGQDPVERERPVKRIIRRV